MTTLTWFTNLFCRVYKKGFDKKIQRREDEEQRSYVSQWLSWLRPSLLPVGVYMQSSLQTTSAVYLQLQLIGVQAKPSWPLLLHALLMKECTLSILLLTQALRLPESLSVFKAVSGVLVACGAYFPGALATTLLPTLDWDELKGPAALTTVSIGEFNVLMELVLAYFFTLLE